MTLDKLIPLVAAWGHGKNIIHKNPGQALIQLSKTQEELIEFRHEVGTLSLRKGEDPKLLAKLELGDILVTLVMASECLEINLAEALELAYNKINKRTGEVVNGIFVKDSV